MIPVALLKRFWKPVALILVVIGLVIGFRIWLADVKADAYRNGEAASEQRHREALDRVNAENRARERELASDLSDYAARFETMAADRRGREQVIVERIEDRMSDQPNCEIDPEIIRMRNEVRAQ